MRALLSKQPGPPEDLVLEEITSPKAGEGQVVIEVKAVGVNFPDTLTLNDQYQVKMERPFSPGCEVSGVVSSLGKGVAGLYVGQRVAGIHSNAMREQLEMPASSCFEIPDDMPFEDAASMQLTYRTAYYTLVVRAQAKPGETVLIHGAAGGVGVAAIEVAKAQGLSVIAADISEEKVDFCVAKGADKGIVFPFGSLEKNQKKELAKQIKAVAGTGVDIVVDVVGGDYAEPSIRALNWGGRYMVLGFPAGIPNIPLNLALLKAIDIRGVFWGAWSERDPETAKSHVKALYDLYQNNKIKPHISERFTLEQGGAALRHLMDRKAKGKVVITI